MHQVIVITTKPNSPALPDFRFYLIIQDKHADSSHDGLPYMQEPEITKPSVEPYSSVIKGLLNA
jgi:hypothetical protein